MNKTRSLVALLLALLACHGGAEARECSGLVADCLHAGGEWFPEKSPFFMTPADLQRHFGLEGIGWTR